MAFNVLQLNGAPVTYTNEDSAQNYTRTLALTIPHDAGFVTLVFTAKNPVGSAEQGLLIATMYPATPTGTVK